MARSSSGMAFNFVSHVCHALRLMDEAGVEAWLLACMDIYDTRGLHPAVAAFKDVERFAREYQARATGLSFDEVVNVLEAFVHGLNGRRLKIECGEHGLYRYRDTVSAGDRSAASRRARITFSSTRRWWCTSGRRPGTAPGASSLPRCLAAMPMSTVRCSVSMRWKRCAWTRASVTALPGVYRQLRRLPSRQAVELDDAWRDGGGAPVTPGGACRG